MKKPAVSPHEPAWAAIYQRMRDGHAAAESAVLLAVLRASPSLSAASRILGMSRYAFLRALIRLGLRKAGSDPAAKVSD